MHDYPDLSGILDEVIEIQRKDAFEAIASRIISMQSALTQIAEITADDRPLASTLTSIANHLGAVAGDVRFWSGADLPAHPAQVIKAPEAVQ